MSNMVESSRPDELPLSRPAETEWKHPSDSFLRGLILDNRAALGTLAVFVVMMAIFMMANPTVFTTWYLYSSVLTTLPVSLFVVVPLVFVVTSGKIDLSFPATMGFASWVFALVVQAGYDPFLGMAAALVTGTVLGFLVGTLVVYAGLSSLIATLGMNFLLRGLIQIINEGKSIALTSLNQSWAHTIFSSQVWGIPLQIFWALAFVIFAALLFNRHRFGAQVKIVGDNPDSAQQMGIDVKRVRVKVFVFVGIGAAIAGTFSTMINFTWWPTAGDGYLPAGPGLGVRRRDAHLGRRRHRRRWGDRRSYCLLHPDRSRGRRPQRLLCPVLQRIDHHPVARRPQMEPGTISLKAIYAKLESLRRCIHF